MQNGERVPQTGQAGCRWKQPQQAAGCGRWWAPAPAACLPWRGLMCGSLTSERLPSPHMHGSQPLRCCDTGPLCLHLVARGSQRLTPDPRWPGRAILHCGQPPTRQAALPNTTPLRRARCPQDGQDGAVRGPEPCSEVTPVVQSCLDKRHRVLRTSRDGARHLSAVPSGVHNGITWEGWVQWQEPPWNPQMPQSPQQSYWIRWAARLGQRGGRSTEQGRSPSPADEPAPRGPPLTEPAEPAATW